MGPCSNVTHKEVTCDFGTFSKVSGFVGNYGNKMERQEVKLLEVSYLFTFCMYACFNFDMNDVFVVDCCAVSHSVMAVCGSID